MMKELNRWQSGLLRYKDSCHIKKRMEYPFSFQISSLFFHRNGFNLDHSAFLAGRRLEMRIWKDMRLR